jgi:hypothetical protein
MTVIVKRAVAVFPLRSAVAQVTPVRPIRKPLPGRGVQATAAECIRCSTNRR